MQQLLGDSRENRACTEIMLVCPVTNANKKLFYIYFIFQDRQSHNVNIRIRSTYYDAVISIISYIFYNEENAANLRPTAIPYGWYITIVKLCDRCRCDVSSIVWYTIAFPPHCPLVSCVKNKWINSFLFLATYRNSLKLKILFLCSDSLCPLTGE